MRIAAGNWKMNPTSLDKALELATQVDSLLKGVDVLKVVFPPFVYIKPVSDVVQDLEVGAQDVFYEESGAYTGEISPRMLTDIGVSWVIIGHSERRRYQKEDEGLLRKKLRAALDAGLKVIYCVGEELEDRLKGLHEKVVLEQIRGLEPHPNLYIAYEPVWAIGTGRNATPEQIKHMHSLILESLDRPVLYGGSVKASNCGELSKIREVQGFLVGGASLDPHQFKEIAISLSHLPPCSF